MAVRRAISQATSARTSVFDAPLFRPCLTYSARLSGELVERERLRARRCVKDPIDILWSAVDEDGSGVLEEVTDHRQPATKTREWRKKTLA